MVLQVFHVCVEDDFGGRAYSFLCPNGTLFRQELQVCEWWFNVDCGRSEEFYPGAPPVDLLDGSGSPGGLLAEEELPPPQPFPTTLEDPLDPSFARSESRPEEQRQSRSRGGAARGGRRSAGFGGSFLSKNTCIYCLVSCGLASES